MISVKERYGHQWPIRARKFVARPKKFPKLKDENTVPGDTLLGDLIVISDEERYGLAEVSDIRPTLIDDLITFLLKSSPVLRDD